MTELSLETAVFNHEAALDRIKALGVDFELAEAQICFPGMNLTFRRRESPPTTPPSKAYESHQEISDFMRKTIDT